MTIKAKEKKMNSKILKDGVKELTDEEFEKQKDDAVRTALIEELDAPDDDSSETDYPTDMERLVEYEPLLKNASKRIGDTIKKGKVRYGDLTVSFEPNK